MVRGISQILHPALIHVALTRYHHGVAHRTRACRSSELRCRGRGDPGIRGGPRQPRRDVRRQQHERRGSTRGPATAAARPWPAGARCGRRSRRRTRCPARTPIAGAGGDVRARDPAAEPERHRDRRPRHHRQRHDRAARAPRVDDRRRRRAARRRAAAGARLDRLFEVPVDGGTVSFSGLTSATATRPSTAARSPTTARRRSRSPRPSLTGNVAGKAGGAIDNHLGGAVDGARLDGVGQLRVRERQRAQQQPRRHADGDRQHRLVELGRRRSGSTRRWWAPARSPTTPSSTRPGRSP